MFALVGPVALHVSKACENGVHPPNPSPVRGAASEPLLNTDRLDHPCQAQDQGTTNREDGFPFERHDIQIQTHRSRHRRNPSCLSRPRLLHRPCGMPPFRNLAPRSRRRSLRSPVIPLGRILQGRRDYSRQMPIQDNRQPVFGTAALASGGSRLNSVG